MSGHSKWSTIKRQKGVADIKRGKTFTKISNAVTIAVKQGGGIGDPSSNFRLRLAIDAAKAANMPKENIERAIKRAITKESGNVEEVIYEGFAPFGVSLIVEAVTDNSQRTTSEVKSLFNKAGANFGQPGSVSYQFKQMGSIVVEKQASNFDEIFSLAVDFGAEDVEDVDDEVFIYTSIQNLAKARNAFVEKGFEIIESEVIWKPSVTISVGEEKQKKVLKFIEELEALDDVQKVYSNLE